MFYALHIYDYNIFPFFAVKHKKLCWLTGMETFCKTFQSKPNSTAIFNPLLNILSNSTVPIHLPSNIPTSPTVTSEEETLTAIQGSQTLAPVQVFPISPINLPPLTETTGPISVVSGSSPTFDILSAANSPTAVDSLPASVPHQPAETSTLGPINIALSSTEPTNVVNQLPVSASTTTPIDLTASQPGTISGLPINDPSTPVSGSTGLEHPIHIAGSAVVSTPTQVDLPGSSTLTVNLGQPTAVDGPVTPSIGLLPPISTGSQVLGPLIINIGSPGSSAILSSESTNNPDPLTQDSPLSTSKPTTLPIDSANLGISNTPATVLTPSQVELSTQPTLTPDLGQPVTIDASIGLLPPLSLGSQVLNPLLVNSGSPGGSAILSSESANLNNQVYTITDSSSSAPYPVLPNNEGSILSSSATEPDVTPTSPQVGLPASPTLPADLVQPVMVNGSATVPVVSLPPLSIGSQVLDPLSVNIGAASSSAILSAESTNLNSPNSTDPSLPTLNLPVTLIDSANPGSMLNTSNNDQTASNLAQQITVGPNVSGTGSENLPLNISSGSSPTSGITAQAPSITTSTSSSSLALGHPNTPGIPITIGSSTTGIASILGLPTTAGDPAAPSITHAESSSSSSAVLAPVVFSSNGSHPGTLPPNPLLTPAQNSTLIHSTTTTTSTATSSTSTLTYQPGGILINGWTPQYGSSSQFGSQSFVEIGNPQITNLTLPTIASTATTNTSTTLTTSTTTTTPTTSTTTTTTTTTSTTTTTFSTTTTTTTTTSPTTTTPKTTTSTTTTTTASSTTTTKPSKKPTQVKKTLKNTKYNF